VTEPSGDLTTASKVVLNAPSNCSSLLLTPDGLMLRARNESTRQDDSG
jgi:hypothetical protein